MRRALRILRGTLVVFVAMLTGPAAVAVSAQDRSNDWRTASRESAQMAPDPATTPEAVIQVYGARAFRWRGAFAVHTWIAVKPEMASHYTTYEVVGWGVRRGYGNAIRVRRGAPDRYWFGAEPEIYGDLRGPEAEAAIVKIEQAIADYPYRSSYTTWPGPNSNTFVAHVLRQVPEVGADLPPHAIGKDFLPGPALAATTPSGTGAQLSFFGLLGVAVGVEEGLEVNVLGLNFGFDPNDLALRLPGFGKVGFGD
ncbi:MAG: DUF3750 domain-containing protein [Alphaproteobacteria bacterium]|nr:DUF3750 domain-containing protein [Alphaproteobacteria bacterium]